MGYWNPLTLPQNDRNCVSKDLKFQNFPGRMPWNSSSKNLDPRQPFIRNTCTKVFGWNNYEVLYWWRAKPETCGNITRNMVLLFMMILTEHFHASFLNQVPRSWQTVFGKYFLITRSTYSTSFLRFRGKAQRWWRLNQSQVFIRQCTQKWSQAWKLQRLREVNRTLA